MAEVRGGPFWVGSPRGEYSSEENPRFETVVADFCLHVTEVTLDDYAACVRAGACKRARDEKRFCNARFSDRGDHPVNCVDWNDAHAFCAFRKARLPTEVEWECAARGGAEYRSYSWGNEAPDGRTCWKHPGGTCKVKSFAAGAFGLYDMIGNVWEWTDDWFGDYPWPAASGQTKVYRGGSWSRRFPKWMRPRLRNRFRPGEQGSHLGFRCALTLPGTSCHFGRTPDGARCLHGVKAADCPAGERWNGQRCAAKGAPECPEGSRPLPGRGCVSERTGRAPAPKPGAPKKTAEPVNTGSVTRARSPEFDADCRRYKPGQPRAFRYSGGTHAARNAVSRAAGCSNRDVGGGWNSTCCP